MAITIILVFTVKLGNSLPKAIQQGLCLCSYIDVMFCRCGLFQIYFLDINKTLGEETQKSFNNQHGVGQAKFVCCDITSHDQLEGK